VVQHLASQVGRKLIVQNLSQQTDSADLVGGFKPVELRLLCAPLKDKFDAAFARTFSKQANAEFLASVQLAFVQQDWARFVQLLQKSLAIVEKKDSDTEPTTDDQQKKRMSPGLRQQWRDLAAMVSKVDIQQREQVKNSLAFSFVEGSLVKAVRNGDWVLLDEINLATTETLEGLSGLLEGRSLTLSELGALEPVARHPDFRIFACMNPPTDVGKKDLPPGLRNRFTEIFVEEMDAQEDLRAVACEYLGKVVVTAQMPVNAVVSFYLEARKLAQATLVDGSNQKTHFSLRTLTRALQCTIVLTH
jgi:midasin (ATPase involved in ribosome maturation)